MNRSDHWQNLALGELLLEPGSVLTLILFYHVHRNYLEEMCVLAHTMVLAFGTS